MSSTTDVVPEGSTRGSFHTLTVAAVERLCDDAVAVTFDVPDDLRAAYDFEAGQSLTLRRIIDGEDHRRDYSICAAVGERPRVGVRLIPGGRFSQWLVHEVRPGDEVEVQTPRGSFRASPDGGRHLCIAAGSGITPMMSIASTVLSHPGVAGDPALRQPDHGLGDVRRGAGRPEEPLRRALRPGARPLAGAARRRAVLRDGWRPHGCAAS